MPLPLDEALYSGPIECKADHLATEYRLHGRHRSSVKLDHQQGQGISFSAILGQRIPSQYDDLIRFHLNGYHLRKYLQDGRSCWSDKVWHEVDVQRFSQHLKERLPLTKSISHLKFVHDQQYLGVRRFN